MLGPTYVDVVAGVGAAEAGHRRHARAVDREHVRLALRMRKKKGGHFRILVRIS